MAINKGYLTCGRTSESDECITPFYAVKPLLEFVNKDKIIWCPFDKEWSAFVQTFKQNGNMVICSHIDDGKNFFEYEPKKYDIIISNPPFSKKDEVIRRLYELGKPFAILLPIQSLQSKRRFECWLNGVELLVFDERIGYHARGNLNSTAEGNHFASIYFCKDFLPSNLVFRKLLKFQQKIKKDKNEKN